MFNTLAKCGMKMPREVAILSLRGNWEAVVGAGEHRQAIGKRGQAMGERLLRPEKRPLYVVPECLNRESSGFGYVVYKSSHSKNLKTLDPR